MFSAEHICQKLGYAETVDGDFKSWVRKMQTLEQLSCEQLLHTAEKYWKDEKRYTLFLKPKKINPLLFCVGIIRRFLPKSK